MACSVVHSANASAQTAADRETARSLMEQGDQAFQKQDYSAALSAYLAAHQLVALPATGMQVVRTHLALGRLVEARELALRVLALPVPAQEAPVSARARLEAAEVADSLARRIPTLRIVVSGLEPGIVPDISVDGERLPDAAPVVLRKIDPGSHRVVASAPGYGEATGAVTLKEGEERVLTLALKPLPAAPLGAVTPPPRPQQERRTADSAAPGYTVPAFIVAGVAVAAGTGTGIASFVTSSTAQENCDDDRCAPAAQESLDTTRALSWASNISFGVAAVGLVVGVVGLASSRSPNRTLAVVPSLGAGSAGVRSTWRF